MQEDVKKTEKVKLKVDCHGIQRNEYNENNVAVQKVELGQGCDPGVSSAPFVNSVLSVLDTKREMWFKVMDTQTQRMYMLAIKFINTQRSARKRK